MPSALRAEQLRWRTQVMKLNKTLQLHTLNVSCGPATKPEVETPVDTNLPRGIKPGTYRTPP